MGYYRAFQMSLLPVWGQMSQSPCECHYVNLEIYLVYPKVTPHTLAAVDVQLPACAVQISTGYMSSET